MNWTTCRAAIREHLGDPVGGIYADAAIDAAATAAYNRVSAAHPTQATLTVTVATGATSVTLPQAVLTVLSLIHI